MVTSPITCGACRTVIPAERLRVGSEVRCPKCGATITPDGATMAIDETGVHNHSALALAPEVSSDGMMTDHTTLIGPSGPPSSHEFPFLAAPRQAEELGWLGPYRVLGVLGAGGMGMVFRGEDPQLKRQIALKVMHPQTATSPLDVARFLREARSQAAVEHEHVAAIHQVGEDRGVPFIAMPLLKGQSLASALKANPRVPISEAVRIAREMAQGLAAAHECGLIHRDIKPANVWLEGKDRRVKILDFGLQGDSVSELGEGR